MTTPFRNFGKGNEVVKAADAEKWLIRVTMPVRKIRKTSAKAEGDGEGQLSKEQREKRKRLFMQQFEKEGTCHPY